MILSDTDPTLVAAPEIDIHIHIPGAATVRVERVTHAGLACIRNTRYGPMRFEFAGFDEAGVPQYRVPVPPPLETTLESIWDGVQSLLGDRPERSALLYSLGEDAPSQVQHVPSQRLVRGAA